MGNSGVEVWRNAARFGTVPGQDEQCRKTSEDVGSEGKTSGSRGRGAEAMEEERKPWKRIGSRGRGRKRLGKD